MDTSVLTRLGRVEVRREIEPLAATGRLARSIISDLEIGYFARSAEEWDRLAAALRTLEAVDVTAAQVRRALDVQRLLARAGLKGRKVPDLVIAAAAEESGVTVLHYDGDFDLISAVTGQRSQWVVPRGSID